MTNNDSERVELNPVTEGVHNLSQESVLEIEEYRVYEWHPEMDAQGQPTAVVLMMEIKGIDEFKFGLRLKSAKAVNELIEALRRHRNAVWPRWDIPQGGLPEHGRKPGP